LEFLQIENLTLLAPPQTQYFNIPISIIPCLRAGTPGQASICERS
jgi:hypothetical protein